VGRSDSLTTFGFPPHPVQSSYPHGVQLDGGFPPRRLHCPSRAWSSAHRPTTPGESSGSPRFLSLLSSHATACGPRRIVGSLTLSGASMSASASLTASPSGFPKIPDLGAVPALQGGRSPLRPTKFPVYASVMSFGSHLLHNCNTRYGWVVSPYPARSRTSQESAKLHLAHQRRLELRAGAQGESPVALPTPGVRVSPEVSDCFHAVVLRRPGDPCPRNLRGVTFPVRCLQGVWPSKQGAETVESTGLCRRPISAGGSSRKSIRN
jgi:hypothetical protein